MTTVRYYSGETMSEYIHFISRAHICQQQRGVAVSPHACDTVYRRPVPFLLASITQRGVTTWVAFKAYWNISALDLVLSGSVILSRTRPARARPWVPLTQSEVEWLMSPEPRLSPRSGILELVLSPSNRSQRKTACAINPEVLGSRCAMVCLPSLPFVNAAERTFPVSLKYGQRRHRKYVTR